jgi:hypothetical protein
VEGYKLASSLEIMLEKSIEKVVVGAAAEIDAVSWASFSSLLAEHSHKGTTMTLLARMAVKYRRERKLVSTRCIVGIESSCVRIFEW